MEGEKILASLDIGTNSTLFLLAKVEPSGTIRPIQHDVRTNDLGRGMDLDGNLSPEVIELNLRLLRDYKRIAGEAGAAEIRIAATEALRKAGNARVFIDRARRELGLDITVITGRDEATLTFRGILSGLPDQMKMILAADIGGGSSEIIQGKAGEVFYSASLPVGAVSLDRNHIRHDPPLREELDMVRREAEGVFGEIPALLPEETCDLVICGGTASSLAAADLGLPSVLPEKIAGHVMTQDRLQRFIEQFSLGTLDERRRIPGIGWRRAEIILPGTIIIEALLRTLRRRQYITSERGLRYGLLVV